MMNKMDLDTPCIVVDEYKLHNNIKRMQRIADEAGLALRPHAKTHKTPQIAKLQLEHGAVGIAVAKLGEAEIMVDYGVGPILIAYPLIGSAKLERLVQLARRADVTVVVDSEQAAIGISEAALAAGLKIPVWIEVDSGYGRTGVQPGKELEQLATRILEFDGIVITGVMTFAGQSYDSESDEMLGKVVTQDAMIATEAAELLRSLSHPIESISIGSTPATRFVDAMNGVTEMRTGTYVFGDLTQVKARASSLEQCALTVLATVVSRPAIDRAVIDAGTKVFTSDGEDSPISTGKGYVVGHPNIKVSWFNEEHGVLTLPPEEQGIAIGDKLEIIPVHCCAVVNMLETLHIVKEGKVLDRWNIAGRGKVR